MASITFRLDDDKKVALESVAERRGVKPSVILREAVDQVVVAETPRRARKRLDPEEQTLVDSLSEDEPRSAVEVAEASGLPLITVLVRAQQLVERGVVRAYETGFVLS